MNLGDSHARALIGLVTLVVVQVSGPCLSISAVGRAVASVRVRVALVALVISQSATQITIVSAFVPATRILVALPARQISLASGKLPWRCAFVLLVPVPHDVAHPVDAIPTNMD